LKKNGIKSFKKYHLDGFFQKVESAYILSKLAWFNKNVYFIAFQNGLALRCQTTILKVFHSKLLSILEQIRRGERVLD
jgi:hypothetical protein